MPYFLRHIPKDYCVATAIILAVLGGLYWPVLVLEYGYSDDFRHLHRALSADPTFPYNIMVQGRPLYALALEAAMHWAGSVAGLWKLRALSLVGVGMWLMVCFHLLKPLLGKFAALAFVVLLGVSPAVQVYVGWAACFQVGWALCFATLGWGLFQKSGKLRALLGFLLLLISLCLYQHAAFTLLFWVWMVGAMVSGSFHAWWRSQRVALMMFGAAILGFLAIHTEIKHYYLALDASVYETAALRGRMTLDLLHKVLWFVKEPLLQTLNFPFSSSLEGDYITMTQSTFFGLCMLALAWVCAPTRWQKTIILSTPLWMMAAMAPSLLTLPDAAPYRVLAGPYMLWFGLLVWALKSLHIQQGHRMAMVAVVCVVLLSVWEFHARFLAPVQQEMQRLQAGNTSVPQEKPLRDGHHEFGTVFSLQQPWVRPHIEKLYHHKQGEE